MELPKEFCDYTRSILSATEAEQLFASLNTEATLAVRNNPAKNAPEWMQSDKIGWSEDGYYLNARPSFTLNPAFHAGAFYVQEASSHFVGYVMQSVYEGQTEGLKVLDACAAPGGKTTLYSTLVGEEGLVVASEQNRTRASVLADNVRKWGLGNVLVVASGADAHADTQCLYDVVAVDAPCSGEGMFRKMEVAREEWSPSNVELCASRQIQILGDVWSSLKPSGTLIYSTCTFNRKENEEMIENFINSLPDDEAVECTEIKIDEAWGVKAERVGCAQTFRFMPHRSRGEGLFVAVLQKNFNASGGCKIPRGKRQPFSEPSKAERAEVLKYLKNKDAKIAKIGDQFYAYNPSQWDTTRRLSEHLNAIYSGTCIGEIFKRKLSPDAALAFSTLLDREALPSVNLKEEDALLFLRKSSDLKAELFAEGFNLVCDENGNGLGFVKRIGNRLNNRYPNTLKILK